MVQSYMWSRNETQTFVGFIWIFVYVLAAQTSAGQAGCEFKTVCQPKGYERIIWKILRKSGYFPLKKGLKSHPFLPMEKF